MMHNAAACQAQQLLVGADAYSRPSLSTTYCMDLQAFMQSSSQAIITPAVSTFPCCCPKAALLLRTHTPLLLAAHVTVHDATILLPSPACLRPA